MSAVAAASLVLIWCIGVQYSCSVEDVQLHMPCDALRQVALGVFEKGYLSSGALACARPNRCLILSATGATL